MIKKLEELSLKELSELHINTIDQFIAAIQNNKPEVELQHLRNWLSEIGIQIKRTESRKAS